MSEPIRYHSTRSTGSTVPISQAIAAGLAPDGGLYVPERLPTLDPAAFDPHGSLADTAATLLAPFFAGDALADELPAICAEAFAFDAPLRALPAHPHTTMLELFHGPTSAFKDFGARFLAACLRRLPRADARPLTILVATSGDTGAAVAAAFHRQPGVRVVILYPDGLVSPRQAHQLGCFGDNVTALRVAGRFDDCQRMVKAALNDTTLQAQHPLSSANSISLGRLLPQMSYYAHAALGWWREHGTPLNFVVPTGNLGNALACLWARELGLPIGTVRLACNANATLPDYFAGAEYTPREAIATLANAMDVGAPSNFERLRWLYQGAVALLYPSFFEGFGIPILEALWSRTPVITSHGSCFAETAGDAALYVDPREPGSIADAMRQVIENPSLVRQMQEKGWQHAQRFTPEKCAAAMMKVYKQLNKKI